MTEGIAVSDDDFLAVIHDFERTAFGLELQRAYAEPEEDELFAAFLRGDRPPASDVAELREWYSRIAEHVAAGKRVQRVRVQEEPPTDYQRFEQWLDPWNIDAGEEMRYLTRREAHSIGLLPVAGTQDWWLLDSTRLLVMNFDERGRRRSSHLVTEPARVRTACAWRDLALHHSTPAPERHATHH